nr:hypothetical protein [Allomuricauda sp.]
MSPSHQRKRHLAFCKICKHRILSFEEGIICGLTQKLANFEASCPTYLLDGEQLSELQQKFEEEVFKEYPKTGLKSMLTEREFRRVPKVLHKRFKSAENGYGLQIKKDNRHDRSTLIIIGFLMVILVWGNYYNNMPWNLSSWNIVAILVLVVVAGFFMYKGYYHNYKTLIKIDKHGIDNRGEFIFWQDIFDYGIVIGKGDYAHEKVIILGTVTSGMLQVDVTDLNIKQLEFVELLQHHKHLIWERPVGE